MILLLGGTSDTAPLAERLAQAGLRVLVSTASDAALSVGSHPNIRRRCGRLDRAGLKDLIERKSILAVVDATHPYATEVRENARAVAAMLHVPYATFVRPSAVDENEDAVRFVSDHREAAKVAFSLGQGVLLTTGSNHLAEYTTEARRTGLPLCVRVLSRQESLAQCSREGISPERTIAGRGPFDVEVNRQHIRQCNAGVLVTKDGGQASGVRAKIEAARLEKCSVIVVRRPRGAEENAFSDVEELARHVISLFEKPTCER